MKGRAIILSAVLSMALAACGLSVVSEDDAASGSSGADTPAATAAVESGSSNTPAGGTLVPRPGAGTTLTTLPGPASESGEDANPVPVTTVPGGEDAKPVPVTTMPGEGDVMPVPPDVAQSPSVVSAVADLADRLGVSSSSVAVVIVEEVMWPDGSIGCPQPGMSYTQALVSGSRIVLEVDGTSYEYHSGGGREPFYCPNPTPPVPSSDS